MPTSQLAQALMKLIKALKINKAKPKAKKKDKKPEGGGGTTPNPGGDGHLGI